MKPLLVLTFMAATLTNLSAQDLAPRAYVVTPKNSNALTLTWLYFNGGLDFNGAVPINNAQGIYNVEAATLYHSFSFFGRSANVLAALPYAVGNFTGEVLTQQRSIDAVSLFPKHVLSFVENHEAPCAAIPLQTTDESSSIVSGRSATRR